MKDRQREVNYGMDAGDDGRRDRDVGWQLT